MKDHFNKASGGFSYKNYHRKHSDTYLWEFRRLENYKKNLNTWSSTVTTHHKGFDDVIYKTIREAFDPATFAPPPPVVNPNTARATAIVNKAFAEALAESTATAQPSLLHRLFGKRAP